jgi:hypothetical protein
LADCWSTCAQRKSTKQLLVWQGKKENNNNPAALKNLTKIRQLIFEGKTDEAMSLANESLNGNPGSVKSYQPLGNLTLDFEVASEAVAAVFHLAGAFWFH